MSRLSLAIVASGTLLGSGVSGQEVSYPETRRGSVVEDYHGTPVADPYRWLEDTYDDETRGWIEAQNGVTFDYLATLRDRETLESRLTELMDFERFGVPFEEGGLYFYTRNDGLQNQSVLYVQDAPNGTPTSKAIQQMADRLAFRARNLNMVVTIIP